MKSIRLSKTKSDAAMPALAKTGGKVAAMRNHTLVSRFGSKSRWIGFDLSSVRLSHPDRPGVCFSLSVSLYDYDLAQAARGSVGLYGQMDPDEPRLGEFLLRHERASVLDALSIIRR